MAFTAQLAKEEGNNAYKAQDYKTARECYSRAMVLDPTDFAYPLNRSMTNLKLQRWSEAELDASKALELKPGDMKAFWRRSIARRELGDYPGARQDMKSHVDAGGHLKDLVEENAKTAAIEVATMLASTSGGSSLPDGLVMRDSPGKSIGMFATRAYQRGELILAEHPLYIVTRTSYTQILSAVSNLPPSTRKDFMSLYNAWSETNIDSLWKTISSLHLRPEDHEILKIHATNAFRSGDNDSVICLHASRFNHSCLPNARHSFRSPTDRTMTIRALRHIEVGEEICTQYIDGRGCYGTVRRERQERLLKSWRFTCSCTTCSLTGDALVKSENRRAEITRMWHRLFTDFPPQPYQEVIQTVVRAGRLMEEEGCLADTIDFTHHAARICAMHSDWEPVKYWAWRTYESRLAEFGGDSPKLSDNEAMTVLLDPKHFSLAGKMQYRGTCHLRV